MLRDDLSKDQSQQFAVSPQREGPLLVAAQPAAVDGGGAGHSVQVMRAVGQRGNPLTVPLGLLFPGGIKKKMLLKPLQTTSAASIRQVRSRGGRGPYLR